MAGLVDIRNVRFLTRWGVWLTNINIILGLLHTPYKKVRINQDMCSPTKIYLKRYSPFALWKIYTLLFQFTLVAEVIITAVFWTALWGYMSKENEGSNWAMFNLITDHSAPLVVMSLDFWLVSTIPFCKRHLLGIIPILTVYLMTNLTYQLITGEPVYPVMDWT